MAWLQNLAGRAEDLLNKIDQNAATVLNESISKSNLEGEPSMFEDSIKVVPNEETSFNLLSPNVSFQASTIREKLPNNTSSIDLDGGISFTCSTEESKLYVDDMTEEDTPEWSLKSSKSEGGMSASSIQNSFVLAEESHALDMKLSKLEFENQDLQKQLLHLKHLYSETKNENNNLQLQLERATEQIAETQIEKDQYKARAQRILNEKERLISMKNEGQGSENTDNIHVIKYNEQLKHELENQQSKNEELVKKNAHLIKEIQTLQIQHQSVQNDLQLTVQSLEQSISKERKFKTLAEDECLQKNNEIHLKNQEIIQLQELLRVKTDEIVHLKEAIRQKSSTSGDFDSTIKNLTHTLMLKQNSLETVTTERNALKLQLERLEGEYRRILEQQHRQKDKILRIEEIDDAVSIPKVLRISPFDAGVTRRVKHAYSTLDAISIRTGIFLRRYPLARVLVFSYMVILHIWVLMILFWHEPSIQ